jgi:predicted DNA-binding mobile mystery protein A
MYRLAARLAADQLDERLDRLRPAIESVAAAKPRGGWLQAIRQALGMSAAALARRLGVSHATVRQYEQGERDGTVSLSTLRRVAAAMDAELVYAIVPRTALRAAIEARALAVASERVAEVNYSMVLEEQGLDAAAVRRQVEALADEIGRRPRELWR